MGGYIYGYKGLERGRVRVAAPSDLIDLYILYISDLTIYRATTSDTVHIRWVFQPYKRFSVTPESQFSVRPFDSGGPGERIRHTQTNATISRFIAEMKVSVQ